MTSPAIRATSSGSVIRSPASSRYMKPLPQRRRRGERRRGAGATAGAGTTAVAIGNSYPTAAPTLTLRGGLLRRGLLRRRLLRGGLLAGGRLARRRRRAVAVARLDGVEAGLE